MSSLVNLHAHSYYSYLDGLNSPAEIAEEAKRLGHPAVAITDHGVMSGHRPLQEACKEQGIKPILGCEMYFSPTDRFDRSPKGVRYNHLIVLAQNQQGLENLYTLGKIAGEEGFYHKPRIDKEVLEQHNEGLIVLSSCLSGVLAKAIEADDMESALEWAKWHQQVFGDRYYIEVQAHNPLNINQGLFEIADSLGIDPVVTMDSHFNLPKDRLLEEITLILGMHKFGNRNVTYESTKGLDPMARLNKAFPDRYISFEEIDVHFFERKELERRFEEQGFHRPEIFDNTLKIADCIGDYAYHEGLELLPTPDVAEIAGDGRMTNPDKVLRRLVDQGLQERNITDSNYLDRVEEELEVITGKNFSNYFLIVADMIQWARRQGIRVGPGRGSAAGSLVCYALGITDIDPLEHGLLFFRFLNPERNDFPDIDVDIMISRREEVKEYLRQKYGHVASIMTFTTFKDKGVIRDISRVFKVPLSDVNRMLKKVSDWDDYLASDNKVVVDFRRAYPEVAKYGAQLRDRVKQQGIHAGGIVVSSEPIEKYAPVEYLKNPYSDDGERIAVIGYDMETIADIGLIKLDLLGNGSLDAIDVAVKSIEERHGVNVDDISQRRDDPEVFKLLSTGKTAGVFQMDTSTYRQLVEQMRIDGFNDLAASNALVRPGAMNTVGASYIKRMHGEEPVAYAHELLEPFTSETYGVIIYQEQVMQTVNVLGGFPMAKADKLRKIIGKKLDVSEFKPYYDAWIEGATRYVSRDVADQLWHDFEAHAGYSFNKSHAVAYSTISYQNAWLKLYYPLECLYGLLDSEKDTDKVTDFLIEAKRLGIKLKLPHVNHSNAKWKLDEDAIRFGLVNIKGVGDKGAKRLLQRAPYKDYAQLYDASQTKGSGITSKIIKSLNAIGAAEFDDHPLTGREEENYYEYLGIPKFDYVETPPQVQQILTSVDEFNASDTMVLKVLVQKIKVGEGWSKIDFIDETGTNSCFDAEDTKLETGQLYYLLVGNNRVLDWVEADSLDKYDTSYARWLRGELNALTDADKIAIKVAKRKTKAGKLMANATFANHRRELRTFAVFPKTYLNVYSKLQEGASVDFKSRKLDDGTYCLTTVLE